MARNSFLLFDLTFYLVLLISSVNFTPSNAKAKPGREDSFNNIAKALDSIKDVVASQSERDQQMMKTLQSIEMTNRVLVEKLTRTSGDDKDLPLVLCQDINSLTSSMQKSSQRANNMMETLHERLKVFEDNLAHMGVKVEDAKPKVVTPSPPQEEEKTTAAAPTEEESTPLIECSLPYKRVGRDCLYFPKEQKTWGEAKQHCRRFGGDLAVPSDIHKDEYKLRPWPDYLKIEDHNLPVINYLHRQISQMKIRNAYVLMGARDFDKDSVLEWTSGRKVQMVNNYIDDTKGFCYYIYMNADGSFRALAHFCSFVEYFFCQQFTSIEY